MELDYHIKYLFVSLTIEYINPVHHLPLLDYILLNYRFTLHLLLEIHSFHNIHYLKCFMSATQWHLLLTNLLLQTMLSYIFDFNGFYCLDFLHQIRNCLLLLLLLYIDFLLKSKIRCLLHLHIHGKDFHCICINFACEYSL